MAGTLDLLVPRTGSLRPLHGYAVLLRIAQITGGALTIEQGALYSALYRLEHHGLLHAEWGVSDNHQRARFSTLRAAGRQRLPRETAGWRRLVSAMSAGLDQRW